MESDPDALIQKKKEKVKSSSLKKVSPPVFFVFCFKPLSTFSLAAVQQLKRRTNAQIVALNQQYNIETLKHAPPGKCLTAQSLCADCTDT